MIRYIPITDADFKSITCATSAEDIKQFRNRQSLRLAIAKQMSQTVKKVKS